MRKKILFLLSALMLITGLATSVSAADRIDMQINNPVMQVDGEDVNIDIYNTAPVIRDSRTLLPVRAVVEAFDGKVEWNAEKKITTLTKDDTTIQLTIGSTAAKLNDSDVKLDTFPVIINERTMLPIRFIAESFGLDVDWNAVTKTVTIQTKAYEASDNTVTPAAAAAGGSTDTEPQADKNVLVAYFSATNNTKNAAENIADILGADTFVITPKEAYSSEDLNYNDENSRVSKEHADEDSRVVELEATSPENFDDYDVVFIGYPIWWGGASWVVDEFVKNNDFTDKTVVPFCTSSSSGIGSSDKDLQQLNDTGNWLEGKRFSQNADESEIKEWLDSLELGL